MAVDSRLLFDLVNAFSSSRLECGAKTYLQILEVVVRFHLDPELEYT